MEEFNSQKIANVESVSKLQKETTETNNASKLKNNEQDKYKLAEDNLLDYFIEKGSLLGDPSKNLLIPPSLQRAKLKKDLREAAELLDLNIDLSPALQILKEEGASYLDSAVYEEMIDQLSKIAFYLDQLDFSKPPKASLSSSLHISESTLQAIYKIGLAKYDEDKLDDSLSLFGLLASLDHENEEYLFRLGIVATKMESWDLALKAYTYALYLNPDLLGARIFSAECYVKLGRIEDAKEEIKDAKEMIELTHPEPLWLEVLTSIEGSIKQYKY